MKCLLFLVLTITINEYKIKGHASQSRQSLAQGPEIQIKIPRVVRKVGEGASSGVAPSSDHGSRVCPPNSPGAALKGRGNVSKLKQYQELSILMLNYFTCLV
ncbi:hypothetical protein AVEN_205982-1 [Araneus ventricosus]|uniref:Uncharacterized protein n=1 Tax=Araneus ventricosus TaxID=182803 RepID=A0A4Y2KX32_ARAVE|nr:hypothetical protein AVEN_205982-1 [Araneus ventricosus]